MKKQVKSQEIIFEFKMHFSSGIKHVNYLTEK